MGAIYSKALQILVWLGNGTDGTEESVSFAADCAKTAVVKESELTQLQAFQNIVSNQYWNRLWIIQEFVLARTVVLMSGAARLSGMDFRELARDVGHVARMDVSPAMARVWPFMKVRQDLTFYNMDRSGNPFDLGAYTWQDMMRLSKGAECRDCRDRVYGMLSLVRRQVKIEVDYTASAQDIFEQIIEVEFLACFNRKYSQKTLKEVGDDDFDNFVVVLSKALGLKELDEDIHKDIHKDGQYVPHRPTPHEPERPGMASETPNSGEGGRLNKISRISRSFAMVGLRRFKKGSSAESLQQ